MKVDRYFVGFFYNRSLPIDRDSSFGATCTSKAYNWLESTRKYLDLCLCYGQIDLYYPACGYCVSVVEMDRDSAADGIALRFPSSDTSRFVSPSERLLRRQTLRERQRLQRAFHQAEPTLRERKFPVLSPQLRSPYTDPIFQIIAPIISQSPPVPQSPSPLVSQSPILFPAFIAKLHRQLSTELNASIYSASTESI